MLSDLVGGSGADRNRTDDLLLAKQVLYQLSYRPLGIEMLPQALEALFDPNSVVAWIQVV